METKLPSDAPESFTSAPKSTTTTKSKSDSSPPPKQQATKASEKTELPHEPEHVYHAFEASKDEPTAIGNEEMIVELKVNGQLGTFFERENVVRKPIPIIMNTVAYWNSIQGVLRHALERLLYLKDHIDSNEIDVTIVRYADMLADGIVINTYLKLRSVNSMNPDYIPIFRNKPKAPTSFEVPVPYALAISQLGQIRVSGLNEDKVCTPVITANAAKNFGLPATRRWSSTNYGRAVEYATKLGMRFSYADLNVKLGSTWWLLRPSLTEGSFTLVCPLPEENFTSNMATISSLFCQDENGDAYNPIFNTEPLGTDSYGTMLRDPHDLIAVSTFFAIEGDSSVTWTVV